MPRTAAVPLIGLGIVLGACAGVAGCSHKPGPAPGAGGPPAVTVSEPLRREVTDYAEYTGRTAAVDQVQVRARVTGYLQKINFKEGTEVKEGTVLYEIDPRPYADAVRQAEAQINLQQAQLKYNQANYERDVALYKTSEAVALATVQLDLSQVEVSKASLEAAQANAAQARLNLDWTKVRAPIDGLLSRTLVTRGNLVTADQTVLTSLVSQDPMYAYFDADEATVLRVRRLIREGKLPSARDGAARVPVFLGLADETGYPHEGVVDFVNNTVSQSTATLQLRGVFANPRPKVGPRLLASGLFVRIRVAVSPPYPALLVTPDAIGTDQNLKYVYVVDEQDKVVRHDVKLGSQHEGLQVIAEGLGPDERVVINGLQHVKPGVAVKPRLVPMPVPRPGEAAPAPPAVLKAPPAAPPKK